MKKIFGCISAMVMIALFAGQSRADWLIDAERLHTSVHGQVSCDDCHADIFGKRLHPDPSEVDHSLADFFDREKCAACHEDVIDEIGQGHHAGQNATRTQTFENCIACHDPHYQLASSSDVTPGALEQAKEIRCALCHPFEARLPELAEGDRACMACHRKPPPGESGAVQAIAEFCFHCHGEPTTAVQHASGQPLIDVANYRSTPHSGISCLTCHPRAAAFEHGRQPIGDCLQCHVRHNEKVTHDAHAAVSCGACHLEGVTPWRDPESGRIVWNRKMEPGGVSPIHRMKKLGDEASCARCHASGNDVGASAMVLPAKSVICMPCHAGTFSVGDTTTMLSLILLVIGMLAMGTVWFSGGREHPGRPPTVLRAAFPVRFARAVKAFFLEGLLQRRLFKASPVRWLLHALIFFPVLFRFAWGMTALILSLWYPESSIPWPMLDKNRPLTAFLFDLSGVLIIVGALALMLRRLWSGRVQKLDGLPASDVPGFGLLGSIVIVGFVLEGMRMAMTGSPPGSVWAFAGNWISRIFMGYQLTSVYGYVWYLHAILTGVFVAYLPFSRMLHMVVAPIVLAMNANAHIDSRNRSNRHETK